MSVPWRGIPLWGLRAGDSAGYCSLCDLFHVERWGLAYIPSAGLCGRRVIFVECPLVARAERVWLCLLCLSLLRWCRPGPAICGFCILCCGVLFFLVLWCCLFAFHCWCMACLLVKGGLIWCSLSAVFVLGVLGVVLGLLVCLA